MLPTIVVATPGPYPGPGKAPLVRPGQYVYLMNSNLVTAGTPLSSIAVQLERTKSGFYYPIGFSVEISFSGTPGAFEVDVSTSDTDQDSFYVINQKLTTGLNASNVGRIELTSYWALFARVTFASVANSVNATVKLTR